MRTRRSGTSVRAGTWPRSNCSGESYAPITQGYGDFLKRFAKPLTKANSEMEKVFRKQAPTQRDAIKAREAHMTQVYNYFAAPGVRRSFCDVALQVAQQELQTPPADPVAFATTGLGMYENAFRQFFTDYETYQALSGAWDRKYGAQYGASQPGYVSIYGSRGGPGVASALLNEQPQAVGEVFDPATGVMVPVIEVPATGVSQPVVQPVPAAGTTSGTPKK